MIVSCVFVQSPWHEFVMCGMTRTLPFTTSLTEWPACSHASRVNSLNDEPASNPFAPCMLFPAYTTLVCPESGDEDVVL
ncbi:hypothetical protein L2X98_31930 [Microbacterium elymi]|uniref:Uncharacterized protein n=1 Tax=Microbacterium elymi TaxID=2909587 RepID=A0ABY5NIM2_9MICO|nr:hypothetical protein [Microbacterium elymi]UUT34974.1 hypothetical protein L2X98_31930 [Microbacterium elymi]